MTRTIQGARDNNFDLVRLVLALIVLLDHSYGASGSLVLQILPSIFSSQLAVEGFFVISGFLIFASYERSISLTDYGSRRLRRIAPAYIAATLLALIIGLSFNRNLFSNSATYKFLAANLTLQNYLHPDLPGVFLHMRYAAVNGPLWTIKLEVLFYILVPIFVAAIRRLGSTPVLLSLTALSILFYEWAGWSGRLVLQHQLPGQLSFFCLGGLIHYHERAFLRYKYRLALASVIVLVGANYFDWYIMRPPSVAVLTLTACLSLPKLRLPVDIGDPSYGTYVYHWPILQAFVALGLFERAPWSATILAVACVALLAILSWRYVERPWLKRARNEARPMPETLSSHDISKRDQNAPR